VIKLGSPGVPDFYQGTDLWDLSLVDPDNRRPVDFARREALLDEVDAILGLPHEDRAPKLGELMHGWRDGRIKLLTTAVGLRLRRAHPDLFLEGSYVPLETEVTVAGSAVGFARIHGSHAALFIGPRLCARLLQPADPVHGDAHAPLGADRWKTSRVMLPQELAGRTFRHAISGAELRPTTASGTAWIFLGQIFEHVPVGLLLANG
jgi:(1->4)-alpha-D-glucan 1-alpha-D-glucosylmutase